MKSVFPRRRGDGQVWNQPNKTMICTQKWMRKAKPAGGSGSRWSLYLGICLLLCAGSTGARRPPLSKKPRAVVQSTPVSHTAVISAHKAPGLPKTTGLAFANEPVILGFYVNTKGWLRGGDTVHTLLEGTPGCKGSFTIPGCVDTVPMVEFTPGRYIGLWQVPQERLVSLANVLPVATLAAGKVTVARMASSPLSVDTIAPQIEALQPPPEAMKQAENTTISAQLSDPGSGVDSNSVHLYLNGRDVTSDATVMQTSVSYTPLQSLVAGFQLVRVVVQDRAGNHSERTWRFTVEK